MFSPAKSRRCCWQCLTCVLVLIGGRRLSAYMPITTHTTPPKQTQTAEKAKQWCHPEDDWLCVPMFYSPHHPLVTTAIHTTKSQKSSRSVLTTFMHYLQFKKGGPTGYVYNSRISSLVMFLFAQSNSCRSGCLGLSGLLYGGSFSVNISFFFWTGGGSRLANVLSDWIIEKHITNHGIIQ